LANQTATEAFTNIRTIAAFGMESKVAELYGEKLGAPTRMARKRAISSGERQWHPLPHSLHTGGRGS
jgi:hypothetical protein